MDDLILSQFFKMVKFLGKVLGDDYEIVLHDVRPNHEGILAIANSHVSGRYSGSPLSDMALQVIAQQDYKYQDFICNYKASGDERNLVRSSTFFIKNENQELIGMLCINYDSTKANNLVSGIYNLCNMSGLIAESKMQQRRENNQSNISIENGLPATLAETIDSVISETIGVGVPTDRLSQNEKLLIVSKLNEKGVFLLKGAVTEVAQKLHCSEASVYRYMSKRSKN